MKPVEQEYLNTKEVCKMSGLGMTFVRDEIAKGNLTAFKVGASLRVRREDVRAWIEQKTAA